MPELRWPSDRGTFIDRDPDRVTGDPPRRVRPGERVEVDPDVAEQYRSRGFEVVFDSDDAGSGFDVAAFLDRTPVDDVADDIRNGEADGHLKEIRDRADRVTVQGAVDARETELAGPEE